MRVYVYMSLLSTLVLTGFLHAAERQATPASSIRVKDGFKIELLRSAQPDEGSWISMTFDDKGRIILSEDRAGLLRLTLGSGSEETKLEKLSGTENLKHCRGVMYAHDSLYVCETNGQGIYRLKDADKDGVYEDIKLICPLVYNSRYGHGANQMITGPDGMIYAVIGNDVQFPADADPKSPYKNYQADWLLPNPRDGDFDPRVGYLLKLDPDGGTRTIICGGLRNQVDAAFNSEGELFTWDADMEWDVGMPWYRPTRINHVVSGGEFGWRQGSGKWPAWYPDSLPSNLDTGLSSPTGILFGTASNWPERYRQALYAADWQNGRLLLIDLDEKGASYQGKSEVFAEGSPLNICDLQFGPDGALYFITGGRGSQSGLYRITAIAGYQAKNEPAAPKKTAEAAVARKIRHQLEALHVKQDVSQIPFIWEHLGSDDAWIRFAARVALENQPVDAWRKLVATSPDSPARHAALMAIARVGEPVDQKIVLKGLKEWNLAEANPDELLWALRTLQLTMIRQGELSESDRYLLGRRLSQIPPHDRASITWLKSELLVAMKTANCVEEVTKALVSAETQEEQIQLVKTLLRAQDGWTPEARGVVLDWLLNNKTLPGGKLTKANLQGMREDFESSFNLDERKHFQAKLELLKQAPAETDEGFVQTARPFVRNWTVDELDQELEALKDRVPSREEGRKNVAAALCLRCHVHGDRGGQFGPDLSAVGKRMNRRTLLESIIEPSKEIDPKYNNSSYVMENGQVISGRTTAVSRDVIGVEIDSLTGKSVSIPRAQILESMVSPTSPMPQGLLNTFTVEEIHDLLAYLQTEQVKK